MSVEDAADRGLEKHVRLEPRIILESPVTPLYESEIIDAVTNERVGTLSFMVNDLNKTVFVSDIEIDKRRQGYGVATYKYIQSIYPDHILTSGQMNRKDDPNQEKPNAEYLWLKLVGLGLAEKMPDGSYRMRKIK